MIFNPTPFAGSYIIDLEPKADVKKQTSSLQGLPWKRIMKRNLHLKNFIPKMPI